MSSLQDEVEKKLAALDPSLFAVASSTTIADRVALLRLQRLVRARRPSYSYLEVGSYLGGTLYPHLVDERCQSIVTVDMRPNSQPDERGRRFSYEGVTTGAMLEALAPLTPRESFAKMMAFDGDARDVVWRRAAIDLAYIDAEHTNVAVFSDFVSILPFLKADAIIAFHDANLISDALHNIRRMLGHLTVDCRLFILPDLVAALALGSSIADAERALGSAALDEAAYVSKAKRRLREEISQSVRQGLHLEA